MDGTKLWVPLALIPELWKEAGPQETATSQGNINSSNTVCLRIIQNAGPANCHVHHRASEEKSIAGGAVVQTDPLPYTNSAGRPHVRGTTQKPLPKSSRAPATVTKPRLRSYPPFLRHCVLGLDEKSAERSYLVSKTSVLHISARTNASGSLRHLGRGLWSSSCPHQQM